MLGTYRRGVLVGSMNLRIGVGLLVVVLVGPAVAPPAALGGGDARRHQTERVALSAPPPDTQPPSTPTGLAATVVSWNQIDLAWVASTDNVGVQGYKLYRDGMYLAALGAIGSTAISDTGLAAATTYTYALSAIDAAGNESGLSLSASETTQAPPSPDTSPPSVPANVTVAVTAPNDVAVRWSASSDSFGVTRYIIARDGAAIGMVGGTALSFRDRSTNPSRTYSYAVAASDAAGNASAWSSGVVANTPSCTACPTATLRPVSDVGGTGFTPNSGTTRYTQLDELTADGDATYIAGPSSGTANAVLGMGPVPAGAVYSVSVRYAARQAVSSGEPGTMNVHAELYDGAILIGTGDTRNLPTTYWTYTDTFGSLALASGSTLRVKLVQDSAGTSNRRSRFTWAEATITYSPPDTNAPSTPTGLTASAVSASQIDLAWAGSTDNVGVQGYKLFRNGDPIGDLLVGGSATLTSTSTTFDFAADAQGFLCSVTGTGQCGGGEGNPSGGLWGFGMGHGWGGDSQTWTWTGTWEQLGVAPNSSVVRVRLLGLDFAAEGQWISLGVSLANVMLLDGSDQPLATLFPGEYLANFGIYPWRNIGTQSPITLASPVASTSTVKLVIFSKVDGDSYESTNWDWWYDNLSLETAAWMQTTPPSFTDMGLAPSTTYSYAVRAIDAAGNESAQSTAASATTPSSNDGVAPTVPTNLVATATAWNQVDLSWTASSDNVGITRYTIFRDGLRLSVVSGTTMSFTDRSTVGATSYSYTVTASDAMGNTSSLSSPAPATTPAEGPDTTQPTVPGDVTAAAVAWNEVIVSWSPSMDDVGVAGYTVYRDGLRLVDLESPETSLRDPSAEAATTYSYTVAAFDAARNVSVLSNPAAVTTPAAPDEVPPAAPSDLVGIGEAWNQVALSWTAASDDIGVAGYLVYRNNLKLGALDGQTTSYVDRSTAPASAYTYAVSAIDAGGNESDRSSPAAVTTPDAPPGELVVAVTAPAPGQTVFSTMEISAVALGGVSPLHVEFYVDGSLLGASGAEPFTISWDTTTSTGGSHALTATVIDAASGQRTTPEIIVTVDNGLDPAGRLEADYAAGTLGVDDHARYGIYSIGAPSVLPERYQSGEPMSSDQDSLGLEYLANWDSLSAGAQAEITAFLGQPLRDASYEWSLNAADPPAGGAQQLMLAASPPTTGDPCDKRYVRSPFEAIFIGWQCHRDTAHFRITYWMDGQRPPYSNASVDLVVPNRDAGMFLTQIEAGLEDAWSVYHDTLGYDLPSGTIPVELTSGTRGAALPCFYGCTPTIQIPAREPQPYYLGHHELFHPVQYQYIGLPTFLPMAVSGEQMRWWLEASAEWAASYVARTKPHEDYPPSTTYFEQLPQFLGWPDIKINTFIDVDWSENRPANQRQYGAFLLPEYLAEGFGPQIIRRAFESARQHVPVQDALESIDDALVQHESTSLAAELPDFWRIVYELTFTNPDTGRWLQSIETDTGRLAGNKLTSEVNRVFRRQLVTFAQPGTTRSGRAFTIGAGGAAYIDLVPGAPVAPSSWLDVTVLAATGDVSNFSAQLITFAPYPLVQAEVSIPLIVAPVPPLGGGPGVTGTVRVPLASTSKFAVLVLTNNDARGQTDIKATWTATYGQDWSGTVRTDGGWKSLQVSWLGGIVTAEPSGWTASGFDDTGWNQAEVIGDPIPRGTTSLTVTGSSTARYGRTTVSTKPGTCSDASSQAAFQDRTRPSLGTPTTRSAGSGSTATRL